MLSFIVFIFALANASHWEDAGCTQDGLLSPHNVPHFWRTIDDSRGFIQDLQFRISQGDRMAALSCLGSSQDDPQSNSYTNKFHLLWECADNSESCTLPPTHALCIHTLRTLHPDATIKLWSQSLTNDELFNDLNIELTRYDLSFFNDLPSAAQRAAIDMQAIMHSDSKDVAHARENSFSHWSDLFRAAVLYKEGGVYTDLDSIWIRPITEVSDNSNAWIPRTPAFQELENPEDSVHLGGKSYFLEGGIMRFDQPGSAYLRQLLEDFPTYDMEMAECWACVGPRQLTRTYNSMLDSNDLPELISSEHVFGIRNYRNFFGNMFVEFDPIIWTEMLNSGEVAAHLFTASPQGGIQQDSTIFHLFRAGGVKAADTVLSASWRHAETERRNLLSSLYYVDDGSANSGSASIGSGSVIYWYGDTEPIDAVVTVTDMLDMAAYEDEVRSIFMATFMVPLSAVTASSDGANIAVVINQAHTANTAWQAEAASNMVAESSVLPNGSSLSSITLPELGYSEATVTVSKEAETQSGYAEDMINLFQILVDSYAASADDISTDSTFTLEGSVDCSKYVTSTVSEIVSFYETGLQLLFGVADVTFDADTGRFYVTHDTFAEVANTLAIMGSTSPSELNFDGLLACDEFDYRTINVETTSHVTMYGITYTEMEDATDAARIALTNVQFEWINSEVESIGQQEIGACQMLAECQADYEDLYAMLTGENIETTSDLDSDPLNWWYSYQINRYNEGLFDTADIRVKDGFMYHKFGDVYVNTCVQHQASWAEPCDSSIGVCSGGENYGFSKEQAEALLEAVVQTSLIHPACPNGCKALGESWMNEIQSTASSVESEILSNLCTQNGKYYLWSDPLKITDTCVAHNTETDELCPLSDYVFCSDIDYDSGTVIYGDVTSQSYSLEYALSQENFRHPQCL